MARTLSRRESKDLTRRRLVEGAMSILRSEGVAAATTGRIAREAGIKQSSFYGHFADRDACLSEVAETIGGYVLHNVRKHRGSWRIGDVRASVQRGMSVVLDSFLIEPELTRIFLRHRTDDSALGRCFSEMVDTARTELERDLLASKICETEQEARVHAELFVSATLGVVDGLISKRIDDRESALTGLTNVVIAALGAALKREVSKR